VKKYLKIVLCLSLAFLPVHSLLAQENAENGEEVNIGKVVVKVKKSPVSHKMVISENLQNKKVIGDPKNVMDLIKDLSIIDFRGQSDLGETGDRSGGYYIRGFEGERFTIGIDGLPQTDTGLRPGGRSGCPNFNFIPSWLIEKVDIIPGPHSVLYPGKSIGGVVDFKTAKPKARDTLKPEVGLSASYGSYNTQNYKANVRGSISQITYDAGYQYYSTDGFLRNSGSYAQNLYGRLGYAFNNGGFISFDISDSCGEYDLPVNNYKGIDADDPSATYDPDYPDITSSRYSDWQEPKREETYRKYSMNLVVPTLVGTFRGGAYYTKQTKESENKTSTDDYISENGCRERGAKIQDEIDYNDNHKTTVGYDFLMLYGGGAGTCDADTKRVRTQAGILQHEWKIMPVLTLTVGARYEHVTGYMLNSTTKPVTGYGDTITKKWDGIAPKSMVKYDMDSLGKWFRDTSMLLGVSRIWHAPDAISYLNARGTPNAIHLKEEQGIGTDFVIMRRLFSDFHVNLGYSFMRINDYMASNSSFAEYTPSSVDSSLWYKDYYINCDAMDRHGVDIAFKGNIGRDLNLNVSYSYQKFINQGDELAGNQEASDKAKHKVKASARYQLIRNLFVSVDYSFQSKQVATTYEEISPDVYEEYRTEMDPYQIVNMGVSYNFIEDQFGLNEVKLDVYVKNLLNEEYENAKGYPMTDRTYGCSLSMKI